MTAIEKKQGPLTDIREGFLKQRCWHAIEKAVANVIRILCWKDQEVMNCPCGAPSGCFRTRRASVREIAEMIGDDVSKRAVQRAFKVFESKTGVITVHREKKVDDPRQNEPNWYTFHSQRWLAWTGKDRPKAWDPSKPPEPPPPIYAARVEAARIAAGRAANDPEIAKLRREAIRVDKRGPNARRAHASGAAYLARVEAERAALEAELAPIEAEGARSEAAGGATPIHDDGSSSNSLDLQGRSAELSSPPQQPASRGPSTESTAEEIELDSQILAILRWYWPLNPLATEENAHLIGETARNKENPKSIVLVRIALERLALKIMQGKARPHIALARGFVKRQWPIAHPPIKLPPRPEEPQEPEFTPEELAALTPEELAALGPAGEDDPTPEERAAMLAATPEERAAMLAGLAGALALDGASELGPTTPDPPPTMDTPAPEPEGADIFRFALEAVRERSPIAFDQWFCGVQFDGLADGVLSLRVRDDFVRDWIEKNFVERLTDELARSVRHRITVAWTIDCGLDRPLAAGELPPTPRPRPRRR
jgi:DnaA N-terminal domain